MAEVIRVIDSVLSTLAEVREAYETIKSMPGLPQAFTEVSKRTSLAEDILRTIQRQYSNASDTTVIHILPDINDCKEHAEILRTTLYQIGCGNSRSEWSREWYLKVIKDRGKRGRVEDLMRKILQDIYRLATYRTIVGPGPEKLLKVQNTIESILNTKSAPDELWESSDALNVYHGGQGLMQVQTGYHPTSWNNLGPGTINNVQGDAHFGPPLDRRRRRALARLDCSSYKEHKDRNQKAFPGTCTWVTESHEFGQWTSEETVQLLWISADPGCGKSVLARHLVDEVIPRLSTTSRPTPSSARGFPGPVEGSHTPIEHSFQPSRPLPPKKIIYFFFKDDSVDQKNVEGALLCLIHQLLSDGSFLFTNTILGTLEELGHKRARSFRDLWGIFEEILTQKVAGEVICVLDALDECDDRLGDLLDALWHLYDSRRRDTFKLKVLFTSRPYDSISRRFKRFQGSGSSRLQSLRGEMEAQANQICNEIDGAIDHKIEELGLSTEATQILRKGLRRNPNRTYLWVSVICNMIERHNNVNPNSILGLIENLPGTVEMTYEKILRQCSDPDETIAALHVILAAARPLSLDEMAAAFAIHGKTSLSGPQLNAEPAETFRNTIRNVCGLFVVIVNTRVYLLHQTARQFLILPDHDDPSRVSGNEIDSQWKHRFMSSDSNRMLATICLRYLGFLVDSAPLRYVDHLRQEHCLGNDQLVLDLSEYKNKHPLFQYCAEYWMQHIASSSSEELDEDIQTLMLRLFDMDQDVCLAWYRTWEDGREYFPTEDMSPLNLASYMGIVPAVEILLDKGNIDVNEKRGVFLRPALAWAAAFGHTGVVNVLLKTRPKPSLLEHHSERVKVQLGDYKSQTPLLLACKNGHESTVEALLETDQPGAHHVQDEHGRTPISHAAEKGYKAIVEILLGIDELDADMRCSSRKTPFAYAAMNGHLQVAKLLAERRDVDLDPKDSDGFTPLLLAVRNSNALIVELILEKATPVIKSQHRWWTYLPDLSLLIDFTRMGKVPPGVKTVDLSVTDADGLTPRLRALRKGRTGPSKEPLSIITTLNRAISSMPDEGRELDKLEHMISSNLNLDIKTDEAAFRLFEN